MTKLYDRRLTCKEISQITIFDEVFIEAVVRGSEGTVIAHMAPSYRWGLDMVECRVVKWLTGNKVRVALPSCPETTLVVDCSLLLPPYGGANCPDSVGIGSNAAGPVPNSIAIGHHARATEIGEVAIWAGGRPILRVYPDGRILVGERRAGRDVDLAPALSQLIRKVLKGLV